jgi:hypothetical protein
MRFISLVRAKEGIQPTPELIEAINKLAEEMTASGVLVDMGGLRPSAEGARLRLKGGRITVKDGPFTEAKEVIGGFAVMQAASRDEAIELTRRFLQIHADTMPDLELECELRAFEEQPAPV